MPWCPKCKNEYREGIATCADCDVELVESLEEITRVPIVFGEQTSMEKLVEFLHYNNISSASLSYDETEEVYEVFVASEDENRAKKVCGVFLMEQQEATDAAKEIQEAEGKEAVNDLVQQPDEEEVKPSVRVYKDNSSKAEDFKTSAFSLLFVGIIGLIVVVLCITGVIPLGGIGISSYFTYTVMSIMFVVFIIIGLHSMKSSKVYKEAAIEENKLTEELKKWCMENLTAKRVDEVLKLEDNADEIKYLKRMDRMKVLVSSNYVNLDDAYLDALLDSIYPEIFEDS